jgi:hypothetical protein
MVKVQAIPESFPEGWPAMNDDKCSNFGNDEYGVVWWGEYAYKHLAIISCRWKTGWHR